jgi:hypothetical protein
MMYRWRRDPYVNTINECRVDSNSGNAYYNAVQNISSSRLMSKDIKIRIHKV